MTEKLYYLNVALKTTVAKATKTGSDRRGHYAVLDRTCFYPEGGGQPADTGTIGKVAVTDVQNAEGEIRHYVDAKIEEGEYEIAIDWERRFDHMQQHTGQHLLSAVFEDELQMVTKSFHLGAERVSIDLETTKISDSQIREVEQQVNLLVRSHLPIKTEWITQEKVSEMELRKKPAVEGDIRLVKIAEIDNNACGGTHLSNTAELGLVKIIRTEKAKGGTRVYFLCGNRAMQHFNLLQSVTDQLTKSLNAPTAELPEAAQAVLSDRKAKEKQLKSITLDYIKLEAKNLQPEGDVLIKDFSGRPFNEVLQLAKFSIENPAFTYLLFFVSEKENIRFVCAKSENAPGDMKELLHKILENGTVKVGGTANLAQGGSKQECELNEYITAFQHAIKEIT